MLPTTPRKGQTQSGWVKAQPNFAVSIKTGYHVSLKFEIGKKTNIFLEFGLKGGGRKLGNSVFLEFKTAVDHELWIISCHTPDIFLLYRTEVKEF